MQDLKEQRFGLLKVIRFHGMGHGTRKRPHWVCKCDCGNMHIASASNLQQGGVRSCGCLSKDGTRKGNYSHGLHGTAIFNTWKNMMSRCYDTSDASYIRYGGRGISVCREWHDIKKFVADVGHRPRSDLTLDRVNNDGNYELTNVRWATQLQQSNNRRSNRFHTFDGETRTQAEWCRIYNINQPTLCQRLRRGWTFARAITEPVN